MILPKYIGGRSGMWHQYELKDGSILELWEIGPVVIRNVSKTNVSKTPAVELSVQAFSQLTCFTVFNGKVHFNTALINDTDKSDTATPPSDIKPELEPAPDRFAKKVKPIMPTPVSDMLARYRGKEYKALPELLADIDKYYEERISNFSTLSDQITALSFRLKECLNALENMRNIAAGSVGSSTTI